MAHTNKIVDTERIPPQSLDAERAVLGTLIVDNATIPQVEAILLTDDFYRTEHRLLFESVLAVFHRDGAVDLTTLCDDLERNKVLDQVGGPGYVASLEDHVITSANIEHHSRILLNKSRLRKLIEVASTMTEDAYTESQEPEIILDNSEKMIFDISKGRVSGDFVHISDVCAEAVDQISHKFQHKQAVTGVATGFKPLNDITSGFQPSDLIILAARPSVGKTAFALNIAVKVAQETKYSVGIFSLEMSAPQLNHRMLSTMARVSGHKIRTGHLSGTDLKKITEKAKVLSTLPIYIDDSPGITDVQLRARAHRLKAKVPSLGLIIVDYLQLMHSARRTENRQQEVSEISHSMKSLARELNIPLIALSQLSRLVERRKEGDKHPVLSDLRESGAIEQDADIVMFVHRPEYEKRKNENLEESKHDHTRPEPGEPCKIIISKQRNGPVGTIDLIFFSDTTLFATPADTF